jgi:hypothetical protein
MSTLFMILTVVGIYVAMGLLWSMVVFYQEWYRGYNIRGEDLLGVPIMCVMWPWVLVDGLIHWWNYRQSQSDKPSFRDKVIIKGRLDARVERALKE